MSCSELEDMNYSELEDQFGLDVYPKRGIVITKGRGALLYDTNGKEYIDCIGGIGSANIGHANPALTDAIQKQANRLISCVCILYNDQRALLMKKLSEITPGGPSRSFLCSSGTEAVEAALKFARVSTGRTEIVAAMQGFHGRTFGALSVSWKPKYREPFKPLVPGIRHVPFNNAEALKDTVSENTAAVILEIIQGEGGIRPADKDYFRQVRKLCSDKGALLIIDEVQTGFGRTGKMFACEHFDLEPDMLCLAKSLAGGVPAGAVVCNNKIRIDKTLHGTTFGGNPLSCAAALASIDYIESNNLAEKAGELGKYALSELKKIRSDSIREVRGLGLMIGIELREKPGPCLQRLMEEGILALPAGNTVLRLLPPLVITRQQIDKVISKIRLVLSDHDRHSEN
ncbi:MAG: aspartate aminotransferase family protein [archaeon]